MGVDDMCRWVERAKPTNAMLIDAAHVGFRRLNPLTYSAAYSEYPRSIEVMCANPQWIPAFAGMTKRKAGMTKSRPLAVN